MYRANLDQLDRDGIASLKADGLHAHAAFVNCDQSELQGGERRDTVLFVLRGASGLLPQVFATIATYNPVTYVIEGVRALVLDSWSNPAIWQGFLTAMIALVIMVILTLQSFQKALR